VVLLTTDFKPMVGGIAEYLHNLWDHVARLHPVTVVSSVQPEETTAVHSYSREVLPELPDRKLGKRFGDQLPFLRKINTAKYFYDLDQYARRTVTSLRANGGKGIEAFIGVWGVESHFWCCELRKAGMPYSLHVHGLEVVYPYYGRLPRWRYEDFRRAKEIIAISKGTAGLVRKHFGDDIPVRIVNPGVDLPQDEQSFTGKASKIKAEMNLPDTNVLLTVARLVPRKGIDLVLKSVKELIPKYPDLYYIVLGDGPENNHLRRLAKDLGIEKSVRFLGEVDEKTKWAMYGLCDVFIMPNRLMNGTDWEGFGIVFLEAALLSKPCIGGNNGGVPDAIEHGITGLLVDAENQKEIALALAYLLGDRKFKQNMGQAAGERARARFNWNTIAADFCECQGWKLAS
jgi:glycosyltransferase involved in cell wall biosynthesis